MRVLGISGSLQRASGNLTLLHTAIALAPSSMTIELIDGLRHLPAFDPDLASAGVPTVEAWRLALQHSDAVLIASPEYGHSLPGALKNAIDWVIGTGEFSNKIVAITAAVPAIERGQRGLDALQQTLRAADATVLGGVPIARGAAFDAQIRALLEAIAAAFQRADHESAQGSFQTPPMP
jgi:chromate reductase